MWSNAHDHESAPEDGIDQDIDLFDTLLLGIAFVTIAVVVILAATH